MLAPTRVIGGRGWGPEPWWEAGGGGKPWGPWPPLTLPSDQPALRAGGPAGGEGESAI